MTKPTSKQNGQASVRSRIYHTLYDGRSFCSKQSLAERCGISMPTLYLNLNELMEEGLVRYSGEERSTGGRRAQGLDIVPDARISVGLSLSSGMMRAVAADLRLQELAYKTYSYDSAAEVFAGSHVIARDLEDFLDEFGIDRGRLLGVGISLPGPISPDHSRLIIAPTLGLRDVALDGLTRDIPYPVYVENDASASGHAECFVRRDSENMAYLSLENGVGGAVLIDGKPYDGELMRSGEFGHICVEPAGLPCSCGKHGCLEPYCSASRIDKTFGIGLEEFFEGVEAHNPAYEALLYDILRHLAIGINNIHMVLDCDVILGGFFSEYLRPYLPILRQYVLSGNAFMEDADFVKLSILPRHITPLGAALFFIREFVNSV